MFARRYNGNLQFIKKLLSFKPSNDANIETD